MPLDLTDDIGVFNKQGLKDDLGIINNSQESSNNSEMAMLGLAGAGAVAGAGYVANKALVQPFLTMRDANAKLRNIGNIYNISPKVSEDFIPKALQDRISEKRTASEQILNKAKNELNLKTSDLAKRITGINKSATDESANLANIIKSKAPEVYKQTIDNFGKSLDEIDLLAEKSGFAMSNKQFSSNVLDNVIEEAKTSGMDQKLINKVIDARDAIVSKSKILDARGNQVGMNMSLSDAKSVISNLTKEEPYSPLSAKLRESWANFLEKESPKEVKPLYEALNAKYKPFAEARNFISKLSNSSTGEFDAAGLGRYIENYIKKGSDTGISKLMDLLGNGNELVPKIEGLSDKFGIIRGLKDTKYSMGEILSNAKASGEKNINALQQKNIDDILNLQRAKNSASELSNIATTASDKLPLNYIGKIIGKTLGVTGRVFAGIPAGAVSGEIEKRAVGYDQADAFQRWFDIKYGSPKTKDLEIERLKKDYQAAMQI